MHVQSLGWEDPLEEGMATHSSILAWRIPMDRGAWQATARRVTESDTTEQLSMHAYIEQRITKDLLYSTGTSTQYSLMTYMGKGSEKEWIRNICTTESLWCIPETNTIL